jgi:hypothetical protein
MISASTLGVSGELNGILRKVYENNKLFFPDIVNKTFTQIFISIVPMQSFIFIISKNPETNPVPSEWLNFFPDFSEIEKFEGNDYLNPRVFLKGMVYLLNRFSKDLESVYRLEAGTKS